MNTPPVSRIVPLSPDHARRLADGIEQHEASFITSRGDGWLTPTERIYIASLLRNAAASENSAHEGYNGIAHDVEQAWQMLEVCGVPRERAKNNLARGIEVLSTRLGREEHFQKAMEADSARYQWLRRSGTKQNDIATSLAEADLDRAIDFEIAKEAERAANR